MQYAQKLVQRTKSQKLHLSLQILHCASLVIWHATVVQLPWNQDKEKSSIKFSCWHMVCDASSQPWYVCHLVVYEVDEEGFGLRTDFGFESFLVSLNGKPLFSLYIQARLCLDLPRMTVIHPRSCDKVLSGDQWNWIVSTIGFGQSICLFIAFYADMRQAIAKMYGSVAGFEYMSYEDVDAYCRHLICFNVCIETWL